MKAVPYYGMVSDSIGYIFLNSFTDKSASEVKNAIMDLKKNPKFTSLIFDLRNNGGGDLDEAIQIVNFFVPKGVEILQTRGKLKNWDRTYKATQEPILADMPLVIMVNRGSASASEIVTGALQDLDRAVIIGERTYGKGLVQTTRPINYNGLVKITSAKYYIPSGRLIQAIDYSNRNPDGSVGRIPDSLTHVFQTANGRTVKDGGGILPDVLVEQPRYSNMSYYLVRDNLIFDYANDYAAAHESIGPVEDFKLSDEEYDKFKQFVISKKFTYDRQSDKALKDLKEIAEFEGYSDDAKAEFEALEAKLNHNVERDLVKFKDELSQILSQEIVKRYYYEKGEIKQTLKIDKELDRAKEILNYKAQYKKILSSEEVKDSSKKKNNKEAV
jgi:Periplasmic protease